MAKPNLEQENENESASFAPEKPRESDVPKFLADLKNEGKADFRMNLSGKVTEGHYKNKERLKTTLADSFKFIMGYFDGLYYMKNLDYGYIKITAVKDERGNQYDSVESQAMGYDFDGKGFGTIAAALNAGLDWLQMREHEHLMKDRKTKADSTRKLSPVDRL